MLSTLIDSTPKWFRMNKLKNLVNPLHEIEDGKYGENEVPNKVINRCSCDQEQTLKSIKARTHY